MPLVIVRKASKLPAFIDTAPPAAVRREHAIAGRYLARFARAFTDTAANLYAPGDLDRIAAAYEGVLDGRVTVAEAVNVVEWFNEADPLASKRWEILAARLVRAYTEIIEDAGQAETKAHGWAFRFTVQKALRPVPINPYSLAWIKERSMRLVRELSDSQRELLREIIAAGFEEGQRPNVILEQIEQTVGLLTRERQWIENRRALLIESGMTGAPLERAVRQYAKKTLRNRAKRIARTETIDAYSQGLEDSWRLAKEEGHIRPGTMQKWVELTASPRTCPICKELGELDPIPIGESFQSSFVGAVERPPAHPNCRCSKILVFPERD